MVHFFDTEVAKKYGLKAAILIAHFQFWIIKNKANGKHLHEGRTWTYCSVKGLTEIFKYFSTRQIRLILQGLLDKGVLLKGHYNPKGYDRTTWYAFQDENTFVKSDKCICQNGQMELSEMTNGIVKTDKPIPDNSTDKLTDEETDKYPASQKVNLSLEAQRHHALTLLMSHRVHTEVARSIVYDQNTPLETIKQVIINGLAKEEEARCKGKVFKLEPGYIVQALNQARKEGKVVSATKLSRELGAKLVRRTRKHEPPTKADFEKSRRRNMAALGFKR